MTFEKSSEQKQVVIRDNALVLYFETAETPFVARYDLDSLAQANFEVSGRNEGPYILTLRDFSGQVQNVGQFASKVEAQQALYAILQALLSHKGQGSTGGSVCSRWSFGCIVKTLIKWILMLAGIFMILLAMYVLLMTRPVGMPQSQHSAMTAPNESTAAPAANEASSAPVRDTQVPAQKDMGTAPPENNQANISTAPEGEAVDADSILTPEVMSRTATPSAGTVPEADKTETAE